MEVVYKATPFVQDANTPYLHQTSCFAQLRLGIKIATCEAYLIGGVNSPDLWIDLADCGHEVIDLAYTLFDHNGRFREKLYHHSVAKGTGVWGAEINTSEVLLIEIFKVSPAWRGQRIGTKLFETLLAEINEQIVGDYYIFVRPAVLSKVDEEDEEDEENEHLSDTAMIHIAEAFYRSLGFRRVGNTAWFCYGNNSNHPSRHLNAALDFRISEPPSSSQWPAGIELMAILADPRISDDTTLKRLRQTFADITTNARNAPRWEVQSSPEGDTFLHKAALACKPETLKYILSVRPDLANKTNAIYYTPLHALEEAMERLRHPFPSSSLTRSRPARPFLAHSAACLECYQALKSFSQENGETLLGDEACFLN